MDVDNEATDVGADVSIIDDDPTQHVINIADSPNSSKKVGVLFLKCYPFLRSNRMCVCFFVRTKNLIDLGKVLALGSRYPDPLSYTTENRTIGALKRFITQKKPLHAREI